MRICESKRNDRPRRWLRDSNNSIRECWLWTHLLWVD